MPYVNKGILREYCQPHDPICAPHTQDKDMSFHLDYFDKWGNETAEWIVSKAREAAGITIGDNNGSGEANTGGEASTGGDQTSGDSDKTSGASDMLKKGINHPIANVFMLLIVLFGL